jgi:hypothetical protein
MYRDENDRLTDAELHAFFDRLFPHSFAGADVLAEIAPEGWEQSPLLACFHPSVEQRYEETVQLYRNIEELSRAMRRKDAPEREPQPEPTLEEIRSEYRAEPVNVEEEVTELIGLCLWDVFSDNHDVTAVDGRVVDIGSFRGAGAFLDEHLNRDQEHGWREGDYLRFYMGTIWIARRADLTPVYAIIFRRLQAVDADWEYRFPELYLWAPDPGDLGVEQPAGYSVSESAAAEVKAQKSRAETARMRARMEELNAQAREKALDQETPATVRAYRQVYGHDPRGWPPALLRSSRRSDIGH